MCELTLQLPIARSESGLIRTNSLIPSVSSLLAGYTLDTFPYPGCSCHHPEDEVLGLDSLIPDDEESSAGICILAERICMCG